jgi:Protein of unknown function (DUF3224)
MKHRRCAVAVVGISLCLGATPIAQAQTRSTAPATASRETTVTTRATGTFEVKMTPQPADSAGSTALGRMTLDKRFHGDLEGTSKGQMLAAGTAVKGSAGYVALEEVTGTLEGHRGTFVLQHSGTMNRGAPQLSITVVPDSGTDELAGLAGSMTIDIVDGSHSYDFEYTLASAP